jgi:predicted nucleotidyltransferase
MPILFLMRLIERPPLWASPEARGPTRAWLFGSRSEGNAGPASDIDIAVEGLDDDLHVEALRDRLNDLPMPYAVDVQALESIKNAALRGHISRCGVLLFDTGTDPASIGGGL